MKAILTIVSHAYLAHVTDTRLPSLGTRLSVTDQTSFYRNQAPPKRKWLLFKRALPRIISDNACRSSKSCWSTTNLFFFFLIDGLAIFYGTSETASPAASDEVTTSTTATCNEAYLAMRQFVASISLFVWTIIDSVMIFDGCGRKKWACS